jgi:integrase/recombinase XerC
MNDRWASCSSMIDSFLKYLEFEKRLSRHTVLAYHTDLQQFSDFLSNTFPDIKSETADYGIVRSWIISLVESGMDPLSVNRKIACLRSYYKFLLRQETIHKDPMMKIRVLKTKKQLPSFVKESDMIKILDQTEFGNNFQAARDRAILEIFYGTGIRLSELITLKENNIDLGSRTIKVIGKRNKERVIPFSAGLISVLNDYKAHRNKEIERKNHGFFFVTEKGDPCYPKIIYHTVKKYLEKTSTERKSPHALRHTYATHLLNKGAEINAVKDLLGHTSLAATQVYTHNSMEKLKKIFEQAHPKA